MFSHYSRLTRDLFIIGCVESLVSTNDTDSMSELANSMVRTHLASGISDTKLYTDAFFAKCALEGTDPMWQWYEAVEKKALGMCPKSVI